MSWFNVVAVVLLGLASGCTGHKPEQRDEPERDEPEARVNKPEREKPEEREELDLRRPRVKDPKNKKHMPRLCEFAAQYQAAVRAHDQAAQDEAVMSIKAMLPDMGTLLASEIETGFQMNPRDPGLVVSGIVEQSCLPQRPRRRWWW